MGLAGRALLDKDEVEGVLSGSFYTARPVADVAYEAATPAAPKSAAAVPKPTHYKVICISLYTKDLDQLDGMVEALKAQGVTKASRSALIRAALEQVDLDKVPRGM
jgi:hypothetical protein